MASATEAAQQANRSAMDPKRLVVIFYLVAGLILALFFEHMVGLIWAKAALPNPSIIEGLDWTASAIVGYLLAAGLMLGLYLHPRTHALSLDVASELMKVSWPSWSETRISTVAVIVASLVAAVLLFCIDTLAYSLMVSWLPALWGKL